jgi:transcriptional regulator NrdR family protein
MAKVLKVKKKSGILQKFSKAKLYKSIRRTGTSPAVSKKVANAVAKRVRNRMPTSKIKKMTITKLRKYNKSAALKYKKYKK